MAPAKKKRKKKGGTISANYVHYTLLLDTYLSLDTLSMSQGIFHRRVEPLYGVFFEKL